MLGLKSEDDDEIERLQIAKRNRTMIKRDPDGDLQHLALSSGQLWVRQRPKGFVGVSGQVQMV